MSAATMTAGAPFRLRLLPMLIVALLAAFVVRAEALWRAATAQPAAGAATRSVPAAGLTAAPPFSGTAARPRGDATSRPVAPMPAVARPATMQVATNPAAVVPDRPAAAAERELLERLRERRAALEARERAIETREVVLAAVERRLNQRIEELARLQQRLEALERSRAEREEDGWRGLVRLYENMRPREAAAIFDTLEMPVLVQILDRMRAAKAAPVLGAMRPERARELTAELARHRGEHSPRPADDGGGE